MRKDHRLSAQRPDGARASRYTETNPHSRLHMATEGERTIINTHYRLHSYRDVNEARGAALKTPARASC